MRVWYQTKKSIAIVKMLSWLFGSPATIDIELTLIPDESGRAWAGFSSGASLTLKGMAGETVGTLMGRLNTYRGPDQQIIELIRADNNTPLLFTTVLSGNISAIISKK